MNRRLAAVFAVAAAVVAGAIAAPAVGAKAPRSGFETTPSGSCTGKSSVPDAAPVPGSTSDFDLTSFDDVKIRVHWFPNPGATPDAPVPTILNGPGWAQAGDTNTNGRAGILGSTGIRGLWDEGYNVLTWDPRGFGKSEGTVEVDSADAEGRDVQRIIDWVAAQPGVQLDRRGDPRMGMAGGSYGGGIQLVTAAIDCRVDAIVPVIAWHSLTTSLAKTSIAKLGWSNLLYNAASGKSLDEHITSAYEASNERGKVGPEDRDWFADRGPAELVRQIRVPTLIVQGTVDTLFTLDEGITNYRILREAKVPTAMLWFCGGHGVCLTNPGDINRTANATLAWFDRYVKGDESVDTGPRFDFVDQNGQRYTADDYPVAHGDPVLASGAGDLELVADGGSGPAVPGPENRDPLAGVAGPITPARASNAVNVTITNGADEAVLLGAPQLKLSYSGEVADGERPVRVFAQLVDDATGLVLGNQTTPIELQLDGKKHTVASPLEAIAFTAPPGATLTLQIVATTVSYAQPRLDGSVHFDRARIELPVATGVQRG